MSQVKVNRQQCISGDGLVLASSPAAAVTKPMALSLCARTRRIAVSDGTTVRILHADNKVFVGDNTRVQVFDRPGPLH